MMKKKFAGIAVGASLIIGGGSVPTIDQQAPAQAWASSKVSEYKPSWTEKTATGTIEHINPVPNFPDDDGDGWVSYAIGINKKGETVYSQITEKGYKSLGKKDGGKHNIEFPAKYKISVVEAVLEGLMPKTAEAAIAYDTQTSADPVIASSITYAHTISGTNTILFVSPSCYPNSCSLTATYNGTSMTQIGGSVVSSDSVVQTLFYLVAPTTGTNNIVVTKTGGTYIASLSQSYTGASQTGQPDAYSSGTGYVSGSPYQFTASVTSVADNSWAVVFARDTADGSVTVSSGGILRSTTAGWTQGFDTNSAKTPAGTINMALIGASNVPRAFSYGYIMASFSPATGGGSPTPAPIIEPIITWW